MKGTVKFFDGTKGWGFITDENKNDVFVNCSNITMDGRKSLDQNLRLERATTEEHRQ